MVEPEGDNDRSVSIVVGAMTEHFAGGKREAQIEGAAFAVLDMRPPVTLDDLSRAMLFCVRGANEHVQLTLRSAATPDAKAASVAREREHCARRIEALSLAEQSIIARAIRDGGSAT